MDSLIRGTAHSTISASSFLAYAGHTHIGLRRRINQDALLLAPESNLFVVADGMGGHAGGEIASRMAVDCMAIYCDDDYTNGDVTDVPSPYPVKYEWTAAQKRLAHSIYYANASIFKASIDNPELYGMGTTVAAVSIDDQRLSWAYVGDSRIYRLRDDELTLLTKDHSLLNEQLDALRLIGRDREEFIRNFPFKNVLMRALGINTTVEVDVDHISTKPHDIVLICSDGVHGLISDDELADILSRYQHDLDAGCLHIIERANALGGHDNITAVLLEV